MFAFNLDDVSVFGPGETLGDTTLGENQYAMVMGRDDATLTLFGELDELAEFLSHADSLVGLYMSWHVYGQPTDQDGYTIPADVRRVVLLLQYVQKTLTQYAPGIGPEAAKLNAVDRARFLQHWRTLMRMGEHWMDSIAKVGGSDTTALSDAAHRMSRAAESLDEAIHILDPKLKHQEPGLF